MTKTETLLQTNDVRVRIMTLQPGEKTAFHHHSEVTDHMVCLSGNVDVICKGPDKRTLLSPGEHCTIDVGRIHQVANRSTQNVARYLLIQGIGRYDFITAE